MNELFFAIKSYLYDVRWAKRLMSGDMSSQGRCLHKMQLHNHVVEKGLTMPDSRSGFGRDNLLALMDLCAEYANLGFDTSAYAFRDAAGLVREYSRFHRERQYALDTELNERIEWFLKNFDTPALKQRGCNPREYFHRGAGFKEFAGSRHSLRSFGTEAVPLRKMRDAVSLASTAPSACNRQSSRVHLISGELLHKVMSVHKGSRGFGDKASRLLIVTTDMDAYFGVKERNLYHLDAGIFVMNLLYALHYYEVGACALNWCVSPKEDRMLRALVEIPDNEAVMMLVACGSLPKKEFSTTCSNRIPVEQILTIH